MQAKRLEQAVKAELLARAKRTHLELSGGDRKSLAPSMARTWTRGQRSSGYNRPPLSYRPAGRTVATKLIKSSTRPRRDSDVRPLSNYGVQSAQSSTVGHSSKASASIRRQSSNELDGAEDEELDEDEFKGDSSSSSDESEAEQEADVQLNSSDGRTSWGSGPIAAHEPSVQLTFRFEGITALSLSPRSIKIQQQVTSGGNSFVVFDKVVRPKAVFQVNMHAMRSAQFNMTMFIDNVRDVRISTCCGYRHSLGAKLGHFQLLGIAGGGLGPCRLCRPPPPRSPTPPPPVEVVKERSPSVSSSSGESIPEMDYEQEMDKYAMDKFEEYSPSDDEKGVKGKKVGLKN